MKKPTREELCQLTHQANTAANKLSPDLLAQTRIWAKSLVDEALRGAEEAACNGNNYVVVACPYNDHYREIQILREEIEKAGFSVMTISGRTPGHTEVLLVW